MATHGMRTDWHTSSFTENGQGCVEIKYDWHTSSFTENGSGCVEIKHEDGRVLVRDTKYLRDPANDLAAEPILAMPLTAWPGFLTAALDPSATLPAGAPAIHRLGDGGAIFRSGGTELVYNAREWDAFTAGIRNGEFDLHQAA